MGRLGLTEILLILLVLVLVFGASKLPLVARGMGDSVREFKRAIKDDGQRK